MMVNNDALKLVGKVCHVTKHIYDNSMELVALPFTNDGQNTIEVSANKITVTWLGKSVDLKNVTKGSASTRLFAFFNADGNEEMVKAFMAYDGRVIFGTLNLFSFMYVNVFKEIDGTIEACSVASHGHGYLLSTINEYPAPFWKVWDFNVYPKTFEVAYTQNIDDIKWIVFL